MAAQGPWGGPTYSYRNARIECCPGAHVCGLFMPGHPRTAKACSLIRNRISNVAMQNSSMDIK
jgi:hypothetical protein